MWRNAMNDRIICFTFGISLKEIQDGLAMYSSSGRGLRPLEIVPVTKKMVAMAVGDVLNKKIKETEVSAWVQE